MRSKDNEALNLEKFQQAYVNILNELKALRNIISTIDVQKDINEKLALENQLRGLQDDFIRLSGESYNTGLSPKEWASYSRTLDEVITQIKDKIGSTLPKFEEEIGQEDSQLIDDPNGIFDEILMDLERNEHQDNLESGDTQIDTGDLYEQKASSEPAKKESQIEQDIEDMLVVYEKLSHENQKSYVEDIEHQVSQHQSLNSRLVSDAMDTYGFGTPIKSLYQVARAAIRESNINAIENVELKVSQFQSQLERSKNDNASKSLQSPLRKAIASVLEVAITELTKIKDSLMNARKELITQATSLDTMKVIKEMLEKGHNLDPLISRRDPNSPHKKFMEEFNSIEAKINAGNNPNQFLERLHEMKAQLEEAKPKIIMGSRRSAAEPEAPVSAKTPVLPLRPSNRAPTSEINITVNVDNISKSIDKLVNSPGSSSTSVQPLKAVSEYNRLRAEIASSNMVNPEKLKSLEENRKILTHTMGFGEQIERLEKLANDSKVLSSPGTAQKMLAEVSKLNQKLDKELAKLEKDQKTNPRANAVTDVINVTLIKLDQIKSKVVEKLPAEQRVKEETRHFKQ